MAPKHEHHGCSVTCSYNYKLFKQFCYLLCKGKVKFHQRREINNFLLKEPTFRAKFLRIIRCGIFCHMNRHEMENTQIHPRHPKKSNVIDPIEESVQNIENKINTERFEYIEMKSFKKNILICRETFEESLV